jgi:RND family efflux transporter MFP subunit
VVALEGRLATGDAVVESARATELDADAMQRRARDDLARTEIAAPFRGVVERRLVELGARVAPGTELFELVDVSRVEIAVGLPASRFDVVRAGAEVIVRRREGASTAWTGTLARTSPTVDTENRTFAAYVSIDAHDAPAPIPPGAFVVVEVTGERYDDVIVVPRSAFVGSTVFVAEPDGEHEAVVHALTPVVRATLLDVVLVQSGIETGAQIVTSNVEQIADGSRVRRVLEQDSER